MAKSSVTLEERHYLVDTLGELVEGDVDLDDPRVERHLREARRGELVELIHEEDYERIEA